MTYEEHRRTLIEYLQAKVELADWHAVWDSAMDLRVLEAEERMALRYSSPEFNSNGPHNLGRPREDL